MGRGEWFATKAVQHGLLFPGSGDLLRLLDRLVRRPWWYLREHRLPMIYLAVEGQAKTGGDDPTSTPDDGLAGPLRGVADRLNQSGGKKIVYARVDAHPPAGAADDPVAAMRDLLNDAVSGLSGKFGVARPIRFPHYAVATWLLGLRQTGLGDVEHPDQADEQIARELRDFVQRRHAILARADSEIQALAADFPWFIRLITRVIPRLGLFFLRGWRVSRWFAGHSLSREYGNSFIRLTRAAATGASAQPDPAALQQLLVDAMLRDLQRAYRRTGALGVGRRRTAYPVLLLDRAGHDSLGVRLLTMINDCRNTPVRRPRRRSRAFRWDPLLVIASGDRGGLAQLPVDSGPAADTFGPADADYAYRWWQDDFEHAGRHRSWVLPFAVPAGRPDSGGRGELLHVGLPRVRRAAMSLVTLAVLVATGGAVLIDGYQRCGSMRWQSDLSRVPLADADGRTQCVGLSTGQYRFFADLSQVSGLSSATQDALRDVENQILTTNAAAARQPGHVTIAYLGILSDKATSSYEAVLEELRGLAVAQEERKDTDLPVRLLLANAGAKMEFGPAAARAIIGEAHRDPSLKAVVGMGQSRTKTGEAMDLLATAGLPMMGTLISATGLATHTPYYHQVGPTNAREAAVAAAYVAQQPNVTDVVVYYSGDVDDMYSSDLHQQASAAFRDRRLKVREVPYTAVRGDGGAPPRELGRQSCELGVGTVAFFAGRTDQFADFLSGMDSGCGVKGGYPRVLAGDDISRFVLNGGLAPYPDLRLDYVSLSRGLTGGTTCQQAPLSFLLAYQKMFRLADCGRARDGRAMLAYDSLFAVMVAVTWAGEGRTTVSPDAVLAAIGEIRAGGRGPVQGKTGLIDFGRTGKRSVPVDKAITVLQAQGDDAPAVQLACGDLTKADRVRSEKERADRERAEQEGRGRVERQPVCPMEED